MTGPHPAGRPWTRAEEAELRELIASKVKVGQTAKKLKRSPGAIYARINSLKKLPRTTMASGFSVARMPLAAAAQSAGSPLG